MQVAPLPIDEALPALHAAVAQGAFVLLAPPGAGKTTRVPPAVANQVAGQVWVLEPRRLAARAAARRMAGEHGSPAGDHVGWHVRFDKKCSPRTRIVVMTEGILLRRLQQDPFLEGVGAVLLDEFHERSLLADLSLGLLAEVRRDARPDLVLGVMSATLDPEPVAAFLDSAPIVRSAGRSFPVQVAHHAVADHARVQDSVVTGVRTALAQHEGDILAFLPGVREIRDAQRALNGVRAQVLPLYGALPPSEQDRVLRPASDGRRVVLATNVAESSVTVPGVRVVVDGGFVRQPRFDPASGLDRLDTVRISRASADQRAGRAGRTSPGTCLRMWSERVHRSLVAFDRPELLRVDLSSAYLQLLAWGTTPHAFGWYAPPPAPALQAAARLLTQLGALRDDAQGLTPLGERLAALPLHPRLGTLLVHGARHGQPKAAAIAAALLGEDGVRPQGGSRSSSDVVDAVDQVGAAPPPQVERIVRQLTEAVRDVAPTQPEPRDIALQRAVAAGWPDRVALRRAPASPRARLVGGRGVQLDARSAVVDAPLFVAVDVADASPEGRVRVASAVDAAWLPTVTENVLAYEPDADAVRARRVQRYGDLELASHPTEADPVEAAAALVQAARDQLERVWPDTEAFAQLRARLHLAHQLVPDDVPEPTSAWWQDRLVDVAGACRSFAQLRRADWVGAVRTALGWAGWRTLEACAPERLTVPSGRQLRVHYAAGRPPVLAVPMQDLFGSAQTPRVGQGRVPVLLHLLAPNGRPQQITDDLGGFWARTWPEVRKELRARYPKHRWPEDPLSAEPGVRRRR